MRANITISNLKSPDRGERKYHMYAPDASKMKVDSPKQ